MERLVGEKSFLFRGLLLLYFRWLLRGFIDRVGFFECVLEVCTVPKVDFLSFLSRPGFGFGKEVDGMRWKGERVGIWMLICIQHAQFVALQNSNPSSSCTFSHRGYE